MAYRLDSFVGSSNWLHGLNLLHRLALLDKSHLTLLNRHEPLPITLLALRG